MSLKKWKEESVGKEGIAKFNMNENIKFPLWKGFDLRSHNSLVVELNQKMRL